ncbi:hypothetical protein [Methylobacter tundripaludum]|uniref:hypothetical protein n=1 Tax=Methylobacter tundripaludum TaxID=173365 RepID=UPI0004DFAF65|nr:hypothetical protein [Methylobacter tundripaludum]
MSYSRLTKAQITVIKNKEKLETFASELRKLSFPTSPISIELTDFVATALEGYLENKTDSLDDAFGLNSGKKNAGYAHEFNRTRARRIIDLRFAGKTWNQVADELGGKDGIPSDEREIRRIADEFMIELMAEEIKPEDLFD